MNTTGTMSDRGADFVAKWPAAISRRVGISPEWMATALVRAGLVGTDEESRLRKAFLGEESTTEIGSLTPTQAKSAITSLQAIHRELTEASKVSCHYCGLQLKTDGTCDECGDQNLI